MTTPLVGSLDRLEKVELGIHNGRSIMFDILHLFILVGSLLGEPAASEQ
jgi:hypothetical protein